MKCKNCGSFENSWFPSNRVNSVAVDGRLKSNEISCDFVLGCDACSETLRVVPAEEIACQMNADMTRPIVGIEDRSVQEVFNIMCDRIRKGNEMKISQDEIALLFPDGLPVELAKLMFPEMSEPLTTDEIRFLMRAVSSQTSNDRQYTIGNMTAERVFKAAGLTNMSDLQAVMDAVERALASQGIKPLEWTGKKASSRFATYWLSPDGKRLTMFFDGDASTTSHEDEAAARKAAQEHHEACLSDYVVERGLMFKPLEWTRGEYISSAKSVDTLSFVAQRAGRRLPGWVLNTFVNGDAKKTIHPSRDEAEAAAQLLHNQAVAKYLQD